MPIVHCPHCSARIDVQSEYSGQGFACWKCRKSFTLPVLSGDRRQVPPLVGCLGATLIAVMGLAVALAWLLLAR